MSTNMLDTFLKPKIAIAESDHARLTRLAETLSRRNPDLADQLYAELMRADVFAEDDATRRTVRMGSKLEYTTDTGDTRVVTLVFPGEEDISAGKISVLTPIGIALIGLSAGDTIEWRTLGGRTHRLTVKRLHDGEAGPTEALVAESMRS
jgi:regulator of nucleoside diphosphate kinase